RAFGIGVFRRVAVIARVGIDYRADRAVLLREPRLQSAPALAVARDDDLALHRHAQALERLVIILHAVIDIDDRRGDIAVALIGDISGKLVFDARGACIARDRGFGQRRLERRPAYELERLAQRSGIEHLEGLDMRIPAPGLELLESHLG